MAYTTLISAAELLPHLEDPDWVIFDCRFFLPQPQRGRALYRESHIPGARYADLDHDLSSPRTAQTGRHPLPPPDKLADWLGKAGVHSGTQVVVYDDAGGAVAARMWWLLKWLGHSQVAVLDGGLPAWTELNGPMSNEEPGVISREFKAKPRREMWVDAPQVERLLSEGAGRLVDARDPQRFTGAEEKLDPVAGHIPGAINLPFRMNLDSAGRFLSKNQLRERLQAAYAGVPGDAVVHMCGSGVTACHTLLAQAHAGLPDGVLYAGSWSEWITDDRRPVATGTS